MAAAQSSDPDWQIPYPSFTLKEVPLLLSIICDISTGTPCPFIPHKFRCPVFDLLHDHSLSHPGIQAMLKLGIFGQVSIPMCEGGQNLTCSAKGPKFIGIQLPH